MKKIYIVYPDKLGTIAPEIYGHFSEQIGGVFYGGLFVGKDSKVPNINGFRKDVIEKLKKINPPVLRWPGGCFAETYDWRDGIGENRPTRISWWTRWDGRYENNRVGTHEFIELCRLVGAKPYLAVNVTTMPPIEIRNWLDYCTSPRNTTTLSLEREKNGSPEPFDIPYIGVGNENWGGGGNMTPDYYALEYRRFATIIENTVPKSTRLFAGGANCFDYNWTHDLCSNLSKSSAPVHGMSFHYYCGSAGDCVNFSKEQWYELIKKAQRMDELIERHYAIAKGFNTQNKMKLVIDEWGCWHPDGSGPSKGYNLFEQQSTMRDAVISALTLNIFNNQCDKIQMANVAQLCNNLHALFLVSDDTLVTTPTYHVFDMFKEHQGALGLKTIIDGNTDIESSVSVSASEKDGYVTLTLANLSCEKEQSVSLEGLGFDFEKCFEATVLQGDGMNSHNTPEQPENVIPVTVKYTDTTCVSLPAASVASIKLKIK